jgi:hypothetical protein
MTSSTIQERVIQIHSNINLEYKIQIANLQVIQQHRSQRHHQQSNQNKEPNSLKIQARVHS